ncbi:MAG: molecular chaperone HscA [Paraglaciecola sp.]
MGIDLGTTNSLVVTVRSGQAETLANSEVQHLLPSVVCSQSQGVIVGEQSKRDTSLDSANTIVSVKGFLGRSLANIRGAYPNLPYDFDESNPNSSLINVRTKTVNPIEASAEILSALRLRAIESLGEELSAAVVTVPAYFDDAQRQIPKDAAQLAGLKYYVCPINPLPQSLPIVWTRVRKSL